MADALVSFWAPNVIQSSLHNPILMGLVISFQSVVGFAADLIFPHILKGITVKKLILYSIFTSAITTFALLFSSFQPILILFLISMTAWGIYYELEAFATYQFIDKTAPVDKRSAAWGIMDAFKNLAYFLGPLAAAFLILRGNWVVAAVVFALLFLGFILFSFKDASVDRKFQPDVENLNPLLEVRYWLTLFEHIWPIILITLFMGFIDSTFWTTGAILTERFAHQNALGGLFLPLYQFPSLFIGFLVARWGVSEHKKKLTEIFLLLSGMFLVGLLFGTSIIYILVIVLASSISLGISYPLLEGVYSDIIARLGKERKHMIAFISAIVNVAYIVWPPIAGLISKERGEMTTFVVIGGATVVVSIFLLVATPRKLHLPQAEIAGWTD